MNQGTLATNSEGDAWIEFKMKEVIELGFLKKNLPLFSVAVFEEQTISFFSHGSGARAPLLREKIQDERLSVTTDVYFCSGQEGTYGRVIALFKSGLVPFPRHLKGYFLDILGFFTFHQAAFRNASKYEL